MMWRTRVRSFIEIGEWERCLMSGEPYSMDDGIFYVRSGKKLKFFEKNILKIQNSRKKSLGNDVENTCAKFNRNRSMGKVFNVGGTI